MCFPNKMIAFVTLFGIVTKANLGGFAGDVIVDFARSGLNRPFARVNHIWLTKW